MNEHNMSGLCFTFILAYLQTSLEYLRGERESENNDWLKTQHDSSAFDAHCGGFCVKLYDFYNGFINIANF